MFRATHCSLSGARKLQMQPLVLHASVVAGCCQRPATTDVCKTNGCNTVFELLMMSGVLLETCWAINKHWNNKF